MLEHVKLMAKYNQRFNGQVYETAAQLPLAQLEEDRGAFFGSVLGTLNHILAADILWLGRFHDFFRPYPSLATVKDFVQPTSLDHVIYPDFARLREARMLMDDNIANWTMTELTQEDMDSPFRYTNTKGIESARNFGEVIMHFLNHQTHHRGQASTLLYQFGKDVGVTDFLVDIPELT